MDRPDVHEAMKTERAMRRRLDELEETQHWVHHVADLDSGEMVTTPLDGPMTPVSRAERLSQLGRRIDPAVFGGPSQRLTPRQPYQPSPEAWLVVARGSSMYSPKYDTIWWDLPREFEDPHAFGLYLIFTVSPAGRAVASISLEGHAFQGTRGFIHFNAFGTQGPGSFFVPVDPPFGKQTVDFTFVPPAAPDPLEIVVDFQQGIQVMVFTGISLAAQPPWIVEPPGSAHPG